MKFLSPKHQNLFRAWWKASRPPFYIATLMPLALAFTASVKDTGTWNWLMFALIILASFLVHLATNLANDLFDHMQGVDAGPNIGGSRVIQEGLLSARTISIALGGLYTLALILAIIIIRRSGQPILWALVVFAALSSFFYVAPPIKYGHRGLGEVFVFLNMGLIMAAGAYIALTKNFNLHIIALAAPIAFMVAGILYYQSLPEIETDEAAGKYTLAVKLGPVRAAFLFRLWWPFVWILMANLWFAGLVAWPAILGVFTCPFYLKATKKVETATNWLELDQHGHLVRKLYLANCLILITALAMI